MLSNNPECELKSSNRDPAIQVSLYSLGEAINTTEQICKQIERAGIRLGIGELSCQEKSREENELKDSSVHGAVNAALSRVNQINDMLNRIANHFDSLI